MSQMLELPWMYANIVDVDATFAEETEAFGISLDAAKNVITLANNMPLEYDFGGQHQYTFTVNLVDRLFPSISTSATVNINVLDANDNSPIFSKEEYAISPFFEQIPS